MKLDIRRPVFDFPIFQLAIAKGSEENAVATRDGSFINQWPVKSTNSVFLFWHDRGLG